MANSYVEMMSAAQAIDMSVKMAFVVVEVLVVMVDLVKSANWLVVMALNLVFIFLMGNMVDSIHQPGDSRCLRPPARSDGRARLQLLQRNEYYFQLFFS